MQCVAFNRVIATDIALPGAIGAAEWRQPDITIRRVAPMTCEDVAAGILWREDRTLRFFPSGVAEYRITAAVIEVAPCVGADEEEIAALLIATALPGLLWLGGALMLHAAAVVMPGREDVVAIAAPSGTGKSTMLAQLVTLGARIVGDDSLCLRATPAGVAASGLPGGYFEHDPDPASRRFIDVDPRRSVVEAPLGSIMVLSRHNDEGPATFRRLAPLEALAGVLSHRHRSAIPTLFGDEGRRLEDAAQIGRVPTFAWSRRSGSPSLTNAEWHAIGQLAGG